MNFRGNRLLTLAQRLLPVVILVLTEQWLASFLSEPAQVLVTITSPASRFEVSAHCIAGSI
jgi:hypothetical protein